MAVRKPYSVRQVNAYIQRMFQEDILLRSLLVQGEVSNCKYHSSGHIYFTLKDASGTLSCVMYAGRAQRGLSFKMKEGDEVVVAGSIHVYERTGAYQLYADTIIRAGVGLLNERYELLKKKLEETGLFSEQYKQPIPRYIKRLGVVTAPTGAAVRDIINITRRRNPFVEIILYPAVVQGDGAAQSIAAGIRALDEYGVDTIIAGRGGGSLEDLWAFNEEIVAQAFFDCSTPIISAVGHETDHVISDYVADLRAPTPSAAAELAVFEYAKFRQDEEAFREALFQGMMRKLSDARGQGEMLRRELNHLSPAGRIRERRMTAMLLEDKLEEAMKGMLASWRLCLDLSDRFRRAMRHDIDRSRQDLRLLAAGLEKLSPVARLAGSYGFITDEEGRSASSVDDFSKGDTIRIRMKDGGISAVVREIMHDERGE